MVTFTCNNCGDSVKKNRVEKHYSMECRRKTGGPNVCCIDCLKDFRQDYDAHTSCQTEDERYSAKGTFVPKEAKNKQQKKQMTWSEIIQSVASQENLSQSFKDILDIFKDNENVPRKEAKFKNFCKNNYHLRRFTEKDIMSVFTLIQEEMKKNQEAAKLEQQQALAAAKEKKATEQSEAKKRSISESGEDDQEQVQAKKVKTDNTEDVVVESKKDKKKKKKSIDIEINDKENNETSATPNGVASNGKLTKAEKKKNKKARQAAAKNTDVEMQSTEKVDMKVTSNGVQNGQDSNMSDKQKKKRNKKKSMEATSATETIVEETKPTNGVDTGIVVTNGISKKKKKNKSKGNTEASEETKTEPGDTSVADEESEELNTSVHSHTTPKKKRKSTEPEKTPFKEIIAKLLKPGTEFKLKALKKMVFAVYKSGEEEVPREVRENFNKKLSKIPNVQVNEKIVKMVK
uniref:Cell growth-regulating nucleolar protein n=1 Tax=Cacopsylla melanoneura TaxID=428564 RepID=A0A8D9ANX6_9HEMI